MYEIVAHDTALNVIMIVMVGVALILIIAIFLINRGVIVVNNNNINSAVTYTGSKMACNDTIVCTNGQVCTSTDIGDMCLSPIGGVCQNLTECVNTATVCDGRCLREEGGLGSLCENNGCETGLTCVLTDGFHRCLIPQGSDLECASFYECVPNSTCFEGRCEAGIAPYGTCTHTHECAGNNICLDGHCQPSDISVPGSVGAYCNVVYSNCLTNLTCQNSPFYDLPTGIGYCVKPQAIPYQACSRFIGCVPVSLCRDDGTCDFQSDINNCTFNECSGGFECNTNFCKALSNIGCSSNVDCQSGVCGSRGVVQIQSNSNGNLYTWSNIYGNVPQQFNTISDIEVKDITTGVVTYSFALYTIPQFDVYSISSTGTIDRVGFTFVVPSGYSFVAIKNVKIFPYNYITFHITLSDGTDNYDKIIFRDTYADFISESNVIITILPEEAAPYDATARNITYYTYDYVGQYLYLIVDQVIVYGFNINTGFDPNIVYTTGDSSHPVTFVIHYTSPYSFVYTKFDVLLCSWRTDVDTPGYYLWNINNFELLPIQMYLSNDMANPPSVGLTFGALNPIENFQFFFYTLDGFYRASFSIYNGSNNYSNVFPIPGYLSSEMTNIIQSTNYPNLGALSMPTCT